jgi:hypothetical protein
MLFLRCECRMIFPGLENILTLIILAADPVPNFNLEPHCREVAAMAVPLGDPAICLRHENEARDALTRQWAEFASDDKALCLRRATLGGVPTYTDLLTCLELERDARALRDKPDSGTGQGR